MFVSPDAVEHCVIFPLR